MAGVGQRRGWTWIATFVAMLALALQAAIPSGFMVASAGAGAAIVICTGHGPLMAQTGDHGQPGKAPDSKSGGVCVFAGHGAAPLAALAPSLAAARLEAFVPYAAIHADLAPGRGLAAPPPPSQGPPASLI